MMAMAKLTVRQLAHLSNFTCIALLLVTTACGETDRRTTGPRGGGGSADSGVTTAADAASNDDAGQVMVDAGSTGNSSCKPQRLVFLGDSIPGCTGVGD